MVLLALMRSMKGWFFYSTWFLVSAVIPAQCVELGLRSYWPPVARPPLQAPSGVLARGTLLYVASYSGLVIFDARDPESLVPVGTLEVQLLFPSMVLEGDLLYLTGEGGLHVVDVGDPSNPREIGTYPDVARVAVRGLYAFVITTANTLDVLDLSNPSLPARVQSVPGVFPYWLVWLDDQHLYAGSSIFDVGNPTNVFVAGGLSWSGTRSVAVDNGRLYTVSMDSGAHPFCESVGLRIYDLSTPTAPAFLGFQRTPLWSGTCGFQSVVPVGDYAYVSVRTSGEGHLQVIDVSDPTSPNLGIDLGGSPGCCGGLVGFTGARSGDYLYIAATTSGLRVFDVSEPALPREINTVSPEIAWHVAVSGPFAYLLDGGTVRVLDIGDRDHPQEISRFGAGVRAVLIEGDYAYTAGGFGIFDVSDPHAPRQFRLSSGASYDLDVVGGTAYLAGVGGLDIYDVSDPTAVVKTGHQASSAAVGGVEVHNGFAYLAVAGGGLQILNVADPRNISRVGIYVSGVISDVAVNGNYAYVARGSTMETVSIANPQQPQFVMDVTFPESIERLDMEGNRLHVACGQAGIFVFDVMEPHHPVQVGQFDTAGWAYAVAASGSALVVADGTRGMAILDPPLAEVEWIGDVGAWSDPGDWDPFVPAETNRVLIPEGTVFVDSSEARVRELHIGREALGNVSQNGGVVAADLMTLGASGAGTYYQASGSVRVQHLRLATGHGQAEYTLAGGTLESASLAVGASAGEGLFRQLGGLHDTEFVSLYNEGYELVSGDLATRNLLVDSHAFYRQTGGSALVSGRLGQRGTNTISGGSLVVQELDLEGGAFCLAAGADRFVVGNRLIVRDGARMDIEAGAELEFMGVELDIQTTSPALLASLPRLSLIVQGQSEAELEATGRVIRYGQLQVGPDQDAHARVVNRRLNSVVYQLEVLAVDRLTVGARSILDLGGIGLEVGGSESAEGSGTGGVVNEGRIEEAVRIWVDGSYRQTGSGELLLVLDDQNTGSDVMVVAGSAMLDGTLSMTIQSEDALPAGTSIRLLHSASRTGEFSNVELPVAAGTGYQLRYAGGDLFLETFLGLSLQRDTESGDVRLRVYVVGGREYVLEVSRNLIEWQPWRTLSPMATGWVEVVDDSAELLPSRFYRVLLRDES